MIMKTRYFKLVTVCLLAVSLFASCLGDLDTLPLDDNELTGEMVYSTPEGYIGMIAKCYAALIQTGQKGGDGGDGDVSGIDEGYSGYTRALFYLQEACTDEIVFQSGGSKGVRAMLYLNWDASTEIVGYPYYRLFMTINYCNEFLRECTESKLQERGVYEALKDEYQYYCAEARFIRAYSYSMLCDLYGSTPFVDETMEVGDMPEQATREEIYNFVVSELEELTTLLKEPKKNEYARVKTQLVDMFEEEDQTFVADDIWGNGKKDKRAQFFSIGHTKETWVEGKEFQSDFNNGYACIKWRNVRKDGSELEPGGTKYSSVDYPMFRTADAYLMAAEAILRGAEGGSRTEALEYVNEIRDRAYMSGKYGNGVSGRISDSRLNLDFLLDERARELHMELVRRTDLIRFGKFTKGYNWDWKGSDNGVAGSYIGKDVDDKYNLFPIPQDEFTTNPNLTQNPDFLN